MSEKDIILDAKDICKSYHTTGEDLLVLRKLSICIGRGEFLAIQGASGSGKSTLLHILGGLDRTDSGSLTINLLQTKERHSTRQMEISLMSDSALNRFRGEHVGFVFQFHHLLPEFDAMENALLPALIRGQPYADAAAQASMLLTEVGLGSRMHHKPGQLSGGEAQRVAIARSLINNPQLLLLDEPTGNLDRERSNQIFDLIENIHKKHNQTIVVVTHDPLIAERAQRILTLADGTLHEEEPCEHTVASG